VDDTSVRAGDPFDYAASRSRDDAQVRERECFYCLSGWVFLGSLDYDGEEVSTPFAVASAAVRGGYAFSPVSSQPAAWVREHSESASGGPASLPVVRPRLGFYGLRCGAPGAEAGDLRPVGAAQDQHAGV
jgi:hypothetical protein